MVEDQLPIAVDPEVLSGTPVFRGTRVPVQTLVDYILDGETLETFLHSFPTVSRLDAVRLLQHFNETLLALPSNRLQANQYPEIPQPTE